MRGCVEGGEPSPGARPLLQPAAHDDGAPQGLHLAPGGFARICDKAGVEPAGAVQVDIGGQFARPVREHFADLFVMMADQPGGQQVHEVHLVAAQSNLLGYHAGHGAAQDQPRPAVIELFPGGQRKAQFDNAPVPEGEAPLDAVRGVGVRQDLEGIGLKRRGQGGDVLRLFSGRGIDDAGCPDLLANA